MSRSGRLLPHEEPLGRCPRTAKSSSSTSPDCPLSLVRRPTPGRISRSRSLNDHGLLDRRLITQLVTTRARGPHLHQLGRDYCSGHEAEPFPGGHARPHSRLVTEMRHEANRLAVAPRIRKVSSRTLLWYSGNPARVLPTPVRYIPNPDGVLGDDDNNRILATSVLRAVSVMCRFPVRRHMP